MFVADKLVYLQLQKTGCTHVAKLLAECIQGVQIGKHNRLTENLSNKYIVGSIRNPWDWYVSLWAFGCSGTGAVCHQVTGRRSLRLHVRDAIIEMGFTRRFPYKTSARPFPYKTAGQFLIDMRRPLGLWIKTYANRRDPQLFREWLRLVFDPKRKGDLGEGYSDSSISRIAGLLTYRYFRLYSRDLSPVNGQQFKDIEALREFDERNNVLNAVIRTESLESDLIRVLREAGYVLGEEQVHRIRSSTNFRHNTSNHEPSHYYYDRESADLVRRNEQFIIDKYGYESPRANIR